MKGEAIGRRERGSCEIFLFGGRGRDGGERNFCCQIGKEEGAAVKKTMEENAGETSEQRVLNDL